MANFDPPFAELEEKRYPTFDERRNGFECGPADMLLFNGLFNRLEAEVGEVIRHAGLTQTDTDFTQLRKAIVAIIASSLPVQEDDPEIDTTQFVLISQARARLPIFPEVENSDGRINVVQAGTGTVRIPGGVTFTHRGIFPVTTEQKDFVTTGNKIYHLRWRRDQGYQLLDLQDRVYNAAALDEKHRVFDSTYDDMLIARVITNSGNVATITNLANKNVLSQETYSEYTFAALNPGEVSPHAYSNPIEINWGRTPTIALGEMGCSGLGASVAGAMDFGVTGSYQSQSALNEFRRSETSRYGTKTALQAMNSGNARAAITAQWTIVARV